MISTPATAYDNSKFPPFEATAPHRGFQYISIHPNDEEWLITESAEKNYLLLYNLRTQRLQRYDLPGNYQYTFAAFSANGDQIITIRKERLPGPMLSDRLEELKTSEICIMNKDGGQFRALPIPHEIIMIAALSPDGKKIAYWAAKTIRKPGSKTLVADFDVREFNLTTNSDYLFAGPFNFYHAGPINYLSDSKLLVGAFGPRMEPGEIWDYTKKYNNSEIYQFDRGQTEIPLPKFSDRYYANRPTVDKKNNIYFVDFPIQAGQSLTRISNDGKSTSWRAPDWRNSSIRQLASSHNGKYLAFIYGSSSIRASKSEFAIGIFQIDQEIWSPVTPPPAKEAQPIAVTIAN